MKTRTLLSRSANLVVPMTIASFATAAIVSAATTIGTDVTTGGNVYASSTAVVTGAINGYGAFGILGGGLSTFSGGFISQGSSTVTGGALNLTSPLSASSGGTGASTAPSYGQILVGNANGSYNLMATSSLGLGSATSTTINILNYGVATSSADNATALQNAINAAQSSGMPLYIPSANLSCYKYTAPLNITNNITIIGDGVQENWNGNLDIPTGNPPLTGSVLCPSSNGNDAIKIAGNSLVVNISDIGIRFQTAFSGTGHGISYPKAETLGLTSSIWKNVKIYGHDGNHYGVYVGNFTFDTFINVLTYGGGGFWLTGTSSWGHFGNSVFIEPYADVNVRGTAYGYLLQASSSQNINLLTFVRPQAIVDNITGLNGGVAPLSSQYIWYMDNNIASTRLIAPDFETVTNSSNYFGAPGQWNDIDWTSLYTSAATTSMSAWNTNGIIYSPVSRTLTDNSSSGAGGNTVTYAFNGATMRATNPVTYPILATVYVTPSTLSTNVSATKNLALYATGNIESTGTYNTSGIAGGYQIDATTTLQASTTLNSIAVGPNALNRSFTGTGNTAVGQNTLSVLTSGQNNSAVGYQALIKNTAGSGNMAFGSTALQNNTTGNNNVSIGSFSSSANTTANENTALGTNALYGNQTGADNTAIGFQSLYNELNSTSNVGVGAYAGRGSATYAGQDNTFIGGYSGYSNGGTLNTFVGAISGYYGTTGSGNILLGSTIDLPNNAGSGQLNIGDVIYGTGMWNNFSNSSAPAQNGSIGVGTTTPWAKLSVHLNNGDTLGTLFAIASSTASATTTLFSIDNKGHVGNGGTAPTMGTCGTSPSVSGSDETMIVTVGTGAVTSCAVNFGAGFSSAPRCTASFQGASATTTVLTLNPSASSVTILTTTAMPSAQVVVSCAGQ